MRIEDIIVELYLKGIPKYKIAKKLKVSDGRITQIFIKRKIDPRNRFGYSDQQLIYMYRRGMTSKEIRKKTLISEKNLLNIFRKNNVRSKSTHAWLKEVHKQFK